ncbi:YdeI/OmpD-associated family protein [Psychroserpens damuponensis]|uniref:YdeI/OmpD-associated family protein n=1 Tax=Psychroserpens damuponensis TaxID=943936 RepID=UPI00058DBEEF|nr:DUF1801 domain-containing protein [Psychroserpens damuponensis]
MKKVNSVEEYIEVNSNFSQELTLLREIINTTDLEETIKWSAPAYCLNGKNVLGLGAFKKHFCIFFHQGVFLKDEHDLLNNAQEDKTKGMRQMRFKSISDINETAVLSYVKEAIENQAFKPKRITKKDVIVPDLISEVLNSNADFKTAFKALTPSCQREYCNYISEAKRDATKFSRLDKIKPMILKGAGLHDKYKKC